MLLACLMLVALAVGYSAAYPQGEERDISMTQNGVATSCSCKRANSTLALFIYPTAMLQRLWSIVDDEEGAHQNDEVEEQEENYVEDDGEVEIQQGIHEIPV